MNLTGGSKDKLDSGPTQSLPDLEEAGTYPFTAEGCPLDAEGACRLATLAFDVDGGDLESATDHADAMYSIASGTITITRFDDERISGEFGGSGHLTTDPDAAVEVTNGEFDVPVL